MEVKAKLMIIACLLLATGYAQRTIPTRRPTTTGPSGGGCLASRLADIASQSSSSSQQLLIVPKKGSGRSFSRNFGSIVGSQEGNELGVVSVEDSYNNSRGITVVTTTRRMADKLKDEVSVIASVLF